MKLFQKDAGAPTEKASFVSLIRKGLLSQRHQEELGKTCCSVTRRGSEHYPLLTAGLGTAALSLSLHVKPQMLVHSSTFICSPLVRSTGLFVYHKPVV